MWHISAQVTAHCSFLYAQVPQVKRQNIGSSYRMLHTNERHDGLQRASATQDDSDNKVCHMTFRIILPSFTFNKKNILHSKSVIKWKIKNIFTIILISHHNQ